MKMQERKTGETKQKIVKYMNWRPFGVSDKVKNMENRKTKKVSSTVV